MDDLSYNISELTAASYLAGLIDGEGNVSVYRTNRSVSIYNTEQAIIDAAKECLDILGIAHTDFVMTKINPKHKPVIRVMIRHRIYLQKIYNLIPLRSSKRKQLEALLDSYVNKNPSKIYKKRGLSLAGQNN